MLRTVEDSAVEVGGDLRQGSATGIDWRLATDRWLGHVDPKRHRRTSVRTCWDPIHEPALGLRPQIPTVLIGEKPIDGDQVLGSLEFAEVKVFGDGLLPHQPRAGEK